MHLRIKSSYLIERSMISGGGLYKHLYFQKWGSKRRQYCLSAWDAMMGRPTADADQASYDILDCVHIIWACSKLLCSSGKIWSMFLHPIILKWWLPLGPQRPMTGPYLWVRLFSELLPWIFTVKYMYLLQLIFDVYQESYFYNGMPLVVGLSKAGLVSNNIMDSAANASKMKK
mgnify:CR=1 FL=1